MSDTPRTDAALKTTDALTFVDFARQLERELADMTLQRDTYLNPLIDAGVRDVRDVEYAGRSTAVLERIVDVCTERSAFRPLNFEDAYETCREDFAHIATMVRSFLALSNIPTPPASSSPAPSQEGAVPVGLGPRAVARHVAVFHGDGPLYGPFDSNTAAVEWATAAMPDARWDFEDLLPPFSNRNSSSASQGEKT